MSKAKKAPTKRKIKTGAKAAKRQLKPKKGRKKNLTLLIKKKARSRTKAKRHVSPKPSRKPKRPAVLPTQILGEYVGEVTHYFPHVNAAAVKIEKGQIRLGDRLHFKGHTTDCQLVVNSLQIDHKPIELGARGDEVGLQVLERVRPGDKVYKPAA